jgi:hypothetical protein
MCGVMKKIKIPDELVGVWRECPRGGQEGFYVSMHQIRTFAKIINKPVITVVPVSGLMVAVDDCTVDHDKMEEAVYWETDTGSHGWCCDKCGMVIQWG